MTKPVIYGPRLSVETHSPASTAAQLQLLTRHYIEHEDIQTPANGIAYFGPFEESELTERLNDAYADLLAGGGNVDAVDMTDAEAAAIYINPREYWMEQLAQIEENR